MALNMVYVGKPCDGLLYYSYEYCQALNEAFMVTQLIVIPKKGYTKQDYIDSIESKYKEMHDVVFDYYIPDSEDDLTLILGRNILANSFKNISEYNEQQLCTLRLLFDKIIVVYSEQDPKAYQQALKYWDITEIYNLCDHDVYPNGVGKQFEKRIHFDVYKEPKKDIKVKNLLLGTNKDYYETAKKLVKKYDDYAILAYENDFFIDDNLNHIWAPADNLLGSFENYIYAKEQFDPAPRIIQECKKYGMNIVYERDKGLQDGGSVYMNRDVKPIDTNPILRAYQDMKN